MTAFPVVELPPASAASGDYPRPQLVRGHWHDLGGSWQFAYDDDRVGRQEGWHRNPGAFDRAIVVPFPPESKASGVGRPEFHPVVWYRRQLTTADLRAAGSGRQGTRMLLHFGAVDYRADVWLDDHYLGHHEGGQTPFSFDITEALDPDRDAWFLTVRAEDDPLDVAQPRGKQDWQPEPHGIWYPRTTGIWQPVWLEAVPDLHLARLAWSSDLVRGTVQLSVTLSERPARPVWVRVSLRYGAEILAEGQVRQTEPRGQIDLAIPRQANGQAYQTLLWSPENPRLVDAVVELVRDGEPTDAVASYLGLRSVGWADGHFMLNDRPSYLRSVLAQGYWPESHLAAPSAAALRDEVQLIKDLGFNAARMHQKAEDPRFLYWADRLGVLLWGESASALEFSPTAVARSTRDWIDIVERDRSHPSIVTWVPLNESWGVPHIAHDPAQEALARGLYHLVKALDPTRLVVVNDGWEQPVSDLWTIHDYGLTRTELVANYPDRATVLRTLSGVGPLGRRMQLDQQSDAGQPILVSEFGGVSYAPGRPEGWGYLAVPGAADFEHTLRELFAGLQSSPALAGFCYTQLTDTAQEANGLADADRQPKLPVERIRSIVLGDTVDITSHRRPRRAMQQSHPLISERTQAFEAEVQG